MIFVGSVPTVPKTPLSIKALLLIINVYVSNRKFLFSVKRRRPVPMKHYDGHVDIPDGLLEAMRKKRQVTAYLVFCRAERPAVMRDFPDGDFTQFSKELGNRWTALDEDKKTYWRRIALRIAQTLTDERETGFTPERARKARDKLVRELEARVNDPPSNTAFDLVANMNIVGEQFTNMANCINFLSFTPGSQEPTGCLDALMDSALVVISSTLGLMAQVPILRDSLDTEIFDDLADNNGMIMPLVHSK
jgi:high mobility group protein 2-like 1